MNRQTVLYISMAIAGAAGLWAIMARSQSLKAPPHIAGEWELAADDEKAPGSVSKTILIAQSGRFVRIRFEGRSFEDYKISGIERDETGVQVTLAGASETFRVSLGDRGRAGRLEKIADGVVTSGFAIERREEGAHSSGGRRRETHEGPSRHHFILILLAQIAVILAASQLVGLAFEYVQQPKVIGEMIAGIMLGPSLLGWLWPAASETIFAADTIPYLNVLSQVGVIFFLFLVGLELDPKLLKNRGHTAVVVSHASIILPFLLGCGLAMYLYPLLFNDTPSMRFSSVALFMGAAMSITAFPVLARILTERNLHKTPVGAVTITCAAVDDVTAWCLLAFVVGFAQAEGFGPAAMTAGMSAAYVLGMIFIVRPLLVRIERMHERQGTLTAGVVGVVFLLVLISAGATEAIGIHALFGAFMMGAIMPKNSRFVRELNHKLEDFIVIVLLPIFFAYTGLKTQIGLLNSGDLWMLTGLIILVACIGKFGGSAVAARVCGLNWRESSAIGILMNTRGLMELVILNIGRELGVITDAVFAMMVLMAIVTTFLTTPILNWVYPARLLRASRMKREIAPDAFGVLIPVSLPRSAKPLIRLADVITGRDEAKRHIMGLYLRRAEEHEAYRAAVDDASAEDKAPLDILVEAGAAHDVPVDPISFVSLEPAADIVRVAEENNANLILMGFHNPVIGQTFLGGTVHRVLDEARTDVAIFIDRGLHDRPKTILVPYLGSPHDRLALAIAARMGRHANAAVTVLHVIPPGRDTKPGGEKRLNAKSVTEQAFADPTQPAPVNFKVVEHDDPIGAVLEQAKHFDLVVIGIAEAWGLRSQLFGWRAERIARDCPSSLLILKKHIGPASAEAPGTVSVNAGNPALTSTA
ncbi:MAG TPA: cation:proton antiporter [Phycisphaerae bacterium]|nr:cation:proton antiporter [Phycisphaerae bacterium]